jgi:hypothetical protein
MHELDLLSGANSSVAHDRAYTEKLEGE